MHSAWEITEKAPPSSGAKFFQTGLPSCDTRQTHRDNTTAAPDHRKSPAEAGLSSLRGFAPVAGKQTRRYITTAGCAAETSQKKPRQRERGLVGPDCLMRAAAERPNRQRQAHHPNAEPHRWLHSARGTTEKAPPERGLSQPCGSPEENARKGNPHRDTTTERLHSTLSEAGTNCYVHKLLRTRPQQTAGH